MSVYLVSDRQNGEYMSRGMIRILRELKLKTAKVDGQYKFWVINFSPLLFL